MTDADVPARGRAALLLGHLTSRITDRLLGTALVVAACDPPAALHAPPLIRLLVLGAAVTAWCAAPMADTRPAPALRWQALAVRRRTTLLPAAAIAVAAVTDPPLWPVVCIATLLPAYLLVTDAWTAGVTAPPGRPPTTPALAAAAAAAVVLLAAQAPLAGTSWARLPASLAVTATTLCLVQALRIHYNPVGQV